MHYFFSLGIFLIFFILHGCASNKKFLTPVMPAQFSNYESLFNQIHSINGARLNEIQTKINQICNFKYAKEKIISGYIIYESNFSSDQFKKSFFCRWNHNSEVIYFYEDSKFRTEEILIFKSLPSSLKIYLKEKGLEIRRDWLWFEKNFIWNSRLIYFNLTDYKTNLKTHIYFNRNSGLLEKKEEFKVTNSISKKGGWQYENFKFNTSCSFWKNDKKIIENKDNCEAFENLKNLNQILD